MRRWLSLAALMVIAAAMTLGVIEHRRSDASLSAVVGRSGCLTDTRNQLAAQSVPSASLVPCLTRLPDHWETVDEEFTRGRTRLGLASSEAAGATLTIDLEAACTVPAGAEQSTAEVAGQQVTTHAAVDERASETTYLQVSTFDGGCVTSRAVVPVRYDVELLGTDLREAVQLVARSEIDAEVREVTDGNLGLDPVG